MSPIEEELASLHGRSMTLYAAVVALIAHHPEQSAVLAELHRQTELLCDLQPIHAADQGEQAPSAQWNQAFQTQVRRVRDELADTAKARTPQNQ